jgi:hypothetical protein
MTLYYTAKDIEELAAKGVQKLEIGPGVTLTDFARETAQQLDVVLVEAGKHGAHSSSPAPQSGKMATDDKYNKPSGCQHASSILPAAQPQAVVPSNQPTGNGDSNTVNRLIDLMGKAIKRGG